MNATYDLGTYRSVALQAQELEPGTFVLRAIGKTRTVEIPATDIDENASAAMSTAWKRLQAQLETAMSPDPRQASPELLARIAAVQDKLEHRDTGLRLQGGKWQRLYALHEEEITYISRWLRTSAERAALLAYANRRIAGAIAADGTLRYNPFNEAGVPTFWIDEDLGVEDIIYYLWTNTEHLLNAFAGNPPGLPYAPDPVWFDAMREGKQRAMAA